MTIAVMQPYIFPYIGYFQMINAVDKFIFYDDVNFIKKGWINRNRILINGLDNVFTVPLSKVSQNNLINESYINVEMYDQWVEKFLLTVKLSYSKAPHYQEVFELVKETLQSGRVSNIGVLAMESVIRISHYLGLQTEFGVASELYNNRGLERQERLINICHQEGADKYINAVGGMELYTKEAFKEEGVELAFIRSLPVEYKQFNHEFVPWLSIIDILMFNSIDDVKIFLGQYELI